MTQSTRTVSYALRANTSGVPGLTAFYQSLERIRGVQDQIKRQGDVIAGLRDKTATIRLKFETAAIDAELKRIQNRTVNINVKFGNTQAVQNDVNTLKSLLASVGTNMQYRVTVQTTTLSLLNTQFDLQITKLQSLISQLRALGSVGGAGGGRGSAGAAGGISAANRALLGELDALNNKWQRGDILAADFGRELTTLQGKLRTAAAGATAGSAEFARLDTGLTRLTTSLRSINTDALQKARTDAGAMRAAFDTATAGVARNSSQFQAASASYSASSAQIIARLQALASSGRLTTTQLGQVNRELQRLAREANSIGGSINHAGLSGSVVNSFAMLGGSFGALAFQGVAVVGMFRSVQAAAGGAGLALGAIAAGVLVLGGAFASLGAVGFKEIQKTQHGLNVLQANGVKDLGAMEQSVTKLKLSLGGVGDSFAKSELTESLADTVKAGLNADESLTLMTSSARLAAAENINLNDATGLLLKNIRQYGGTVADAARTGDMLAKAGNLAAGTANDLSVGLGIVGTTGKQAGIEMYDLLGQLVELDNRGMNAADVGANGLRAAIAALGDPTDKARGILKGLGIEINGVDGKARPAGDIMVDLGQKLRGMGIVADKTTGELSGNGEALRTVAGIMDNRAAAAVLGLTGDWKKYSEEIKNSKGELESYANIMQQGLAPALKGLKTAWADAGGTFAKSFVGPMTAFLGTLTNVVKELDKLLGLVGEAKNAKEVNLSLKINADDDLTTFIIKFLMGTGQAVKGVAGAALSVPFVPTQELIDAALERQAQRGGMNGPARATMLKNDLTRNGLLPQLTGTADRAQYEEIKSNVPKYEKLWDDFIDAAVAKARAGGLSFGNAPAASGGMQPLSGQGPLSPGQTRVDPNALKDGQKQFSYEFISGLGAAIKNDPRVASDCAIVAFEILKQLGVAVKGTAVDNAWVPNLEKNAKASGFTQVGLGDVKPGDLVIFKTGNGIKYGAGSNMHAGVAAGYKDGLLQVTDNPGTQANGQDGITRTRNIGSDAQNATFYRAPNSPYPAVNSLITAESAAKAEPKSFETYIVEARRILAAVSKYAAGGSAPDPDKWRKATATLAKFKDQSDLTAQAIDWASSETKKAGAEVSKYGQTFDKLKKKLDITGQLDQMGRPAAEVVKHLQDVKVSAEQAAAAEGKRFGTTNGGTEKYRQLSLLAADAAKQLKAIENRKPDLSPVQKEQQQLAEARAVEATTKAMRGKSAQQLLDIKSGGVQREGDLERVNLAKAEIKRRADLEDDAGKKNAALAIQIASEAAAGREKEARAGLESLKRSQAERLDLAQDDAIKRQAIITQTGPQIIGAEETINRRVREQAVKAAQQTADERGKVAGADTKAIEQARRDAVAGAYRVEKEANAAALSEQGKTERGAARTAAQEKKQLAQELAGLQIDAARSTSSRLKTIGDEDIRIHEGDLKKQVALTRLYSQQEFDRQQQIAIATRRLAYEGAAGKPNETALREKAQAEYLETVETARVARLGTVRTATEAAAKGQEEFNKTLEEGVKAGNDALDSLNGLNLGGRDLVDTAQKLGGTRAQFDTLYNRIVILRDELAEPGVADAWAQSIEDMGKAGQLSAVQVQTLKDVLKDLAGPRESLLPDNLAGRGVTNAAAADDGSRGTLASGEGDRLLAAMQQMSLDDVGRVLAGLVKAGLEKSELGQLVKDYLDAQAEAVDASLREFGGLSSGTAQVRPNGLIMDGEDIYQTEEEIRNLGVTTDATTETFFNLAEAIANIGDFDQDGLQGLIRLGGLGADAALQLWAAWNEKNPVDIGAQLDAITQAQTLLDTLEGATDPAQIQNISGDIGTFLASDVGKLLPDAVKQGLEAGVADGESYRTLISDLTAQGVSDGLQDAVTRTDGASLPNKRFQDFATQIQGGAFDLSNPETLRGLNDGLELARQKGELTASQLDTLKIIIDSINAHPLNVLDHAEGWKQLETWNDKLGELETNLQSGAISQKEFNDQGAAMLPTLDRMADRADDGSEEGKKLAAAFRIAAAALRDMGAASSESAIKLDRLKADLLNVGQAVQGIFSMFGQDDLAQGMGALTGAVSSGFEAVTKFKSGDIFGAAAASVNVLDNVGKAIDSFNPKLKALQKEMLELADAEKQAMGSRMVGGSGGQNGFLNPYYDALKKDSEALTRKANANFWQRLKWDVFGGAPEVLEKGASETLQKASTIFNDFGSSLYSTLESELTSAMEDGDFSKASANIGKMLDRFVNRLTIQALIAKSKLGDLAKQLADEVAGGQDTGGTLAQIRTETDNVIGQAQAIAPTPSSSPTSPGSPEQSAVTGANFYVANSSKIDVFDGAVTRMDAMYQRHEGILSRHGDVLGRHSDMLERLMRDGIILKDTQGNYRGALR